VIDIDGDGLSQVVMAPEIARHAASPLALDHKLDVFSVGHLCASQTTDMLVLSSSSLLTVAQLQTDVFYILMAIFENRTTHYPQAVGGLTAYCCIQTSQENIILSRSDNFGS